MLLTMLILSLFLLVGGAGLFLLAVLAAANHPTGGDDGIEVMAAIGGIASGLGLLCLIISGAGLLLS